jgi:hypothetical protein
VFDKNGLPRAESDIRKNAAIFAQGDFVVGAAVNVIENHFGQTALR